MKKCRQILNKLLFPGIGIIIFGILVSTVLLVYTFASGHTEEPVAYVSYAISAYTTVIVCVRIPKIVKAANALIHRNHHAHRFLTDVSFRLHVSLYVSMGINLLFAAMKLILGAYYRSVWFGTFGAYYGSLAVMRFLLLRHANRNTFGKDMVSELKRYRLCGIILVLMNIALFGAVILIIRQNQSADYAGYLIYVVAMYAFYSVVAAIINVVKYRRYNSPVMSAEKAINMAAAFVSMLLLETAMLTRFDDGSSSPIFRQIMTAATGGTVCAFILGMAVFMIIKANIRLKKLLCNRPDEMNT